MFGSAAPVFIALLGWCFFDRTLGGRQVAGVVLGLLGLAAMAWSSSSAPR